MMHRPQVFLSAHNIVEYIIAVSAYEIIALSNGAFRKFLLKGGIIIIFTAEINQKFYIAYISHNWLCSWG